MSRQPYMAFYVGDWRRSIDVQSLPYKERGIWFEMLCLMHDSPRRGELAFTNGTPMADDEIARQLGLSKQDFTQSLDLLLRANVTERNETGALICRRMVREREISEARSMAGKSGASSKHSGKPLAKPWQNTDIDIESEYEAAWGKGGAGGKGAFIAAWGDWVAYRKARSSAPKDWILFWKKQIEFLSQYPPLVAAEIINRSIRNNWIGLFEPSKAENQQVKGQPQPEKLLVNSSGQLMPEFQ